MATVHLDEAATTLLEPVRAALEAGLDSLGNPSLRVTVGPCADTHRAEPGAVVLSEGLLHGVHHPTEPPGPLPPLDRWRRALGAVFEGAALTRAGAPVQAPERWWWVGTAVQRADMAAPELGLALPDLVCALQTASPGRHPRAGVAVARWWVAEGRDPVAEARRVDAEGDVPAEEWLEAGRWLFSGRGPRRELPVGVELVSEVDIPIALEAWSWARLSVPAHPRGGLVGVVGAGAVHQPWARGGEPLRTIAGATAAGATLEPRAGGPIGTWEVQSAEGFGQVMGARGVSYVFHPDGRFEVVMADAFVGPLAALEMAEKVGTSGVCTGRWQVAGPRAVRLSDIDPSALTMHGRQERFMMPAQGLGMAEWLRSLDEHPWSWQLRDDGGLRLEGRMMGGTVVARLRAGR